jgi:hypothetical protein
MPVLRPSSSRIDPRRYNGASLLGLRGIVLKSHGGADAVAFANAIRIRHPGSGQRGAGTLIASGWMHRWLSKADASDLYASLPALAATCPKRSLTNHDLERMVDTSDSVDSGAHRHRRTAYRAPGDDHLRPGGEGRCAVALEAPARPPRTSTSWWWPPPRRTGSSPAPPACCSSALDIHGCAAFDVQAVCTGFVYALGVADKFIRTGSAKLCPGGRRRDHVAHCRLERSRHLRAVR